MFDTSIWVLVTARQDLYAQAPFKGATLYPAQAADSFQGWTDRYSSVWPLLNLAGKAHATVTK